MMKIEYMTPPLIKEILEQQRMILAMHQQLIETLAKPPLQYHIEALKGVTKLDMEEIAKSAGEK